METALKGVNELAERRELEGCLEGLRRQISALRDLALAIDADGFLVAQHDFTQPIGPGFWNLYA